MYLLRIKIVHYYSVVKSKRIVYAGKNMSECNIGRHNTGREDR